MEPELPEKQAPDNHAGGKENTSDQKQIGTGQSDKGTKSIFAAFFHDDFFRFLTGIAIGCWMVHEFIFDAHKIFLFAGIIFTFADVFYVLGHKILPDHWWLKAAIWPVYLAGMFVVFHFKNNQESTTNEIKPAISQAVAQLGDGVNMIQTSETIFNPLDFSIFDVTLQIAINGNGVSAESVNLIFPAHEADYREYPDDNMTYTAAYTERTDYLHDPTNQRISLVIGWIPGHSHYGFNISGTSSKNSFARIELKSFSTNSPPIFKTSTNIFWPYAPFKGDARGYIISNSFGLGLVITNFVYQPIEEVGKWKHIRIKNY